MPRNEIKTPSLSPRLIAGFVNTTIIVIVIVALCTGNILTGDHGEAGQPDQRVTTEGKSGLSLWLCDLYNDHRLLYSLVVTLTMAILGMGVAQLTELVMKLIGAGKPRAPH